MKNKILLFVIPCLVAVISFASLENKAEAFTRISSQLDQGESGMDVTNLQTFLASNSLVYPEGLVTGYFGPLTANAVSQFQIGYNMPAVGRVGPQTLLTYNSLVDAGRNIDVSAPVMSTININVTNDSARFAWNNNEAVTAKVFYSTTPISVRETSTSKTEPFVSGVSMSDLTLSTSKSIMVEGLQEDTLYYFVVLVKDLAGNVTVTLPRSFTTND